MAQRQLCARAYLQCRALIFRKTRLARGPEADWLEPLGDWLEKDFTSSTGTTPQTSICEAELDWLWRNWTGSVESDWLQPVLFL
jgi:hypothetical protein